jgi:N-acetyl-gamma-glutamyl-phosphate reductase
VRHLRAAPLDRGILATIYTRVTRDTTEDEIGMALWHAYNEAPFVRLTRDRLPEIKHVAHTNFCDIGWKLEPDGRRLVMVAALDNLLKGAAGQAVQNFNLAYGLDEAAGLL